MYKKNRLATLVILSVVVSSSAKAQDAYTVKKDPDLYVFWITVNASIKISKETRKEAYVIRTARKKPKGDKHIAYEEFLYKSLKGGRQIPIGPFWEYNDALRAAEMYNLAKHTTETMDEEIRNFHDSTAINEYYWFFLKFKFSKRKKKILLERTAARVAFGDLKEFKQVLWEGIFFKQLAVGPFPTQEEAEEAKRLYQIRRRLSRPKRPAQTLLFLPKHFHCNLILRIWAFYKKQIAFKPGVLSSKLIG